MCINTVLNLSSEAYYIGVVGISELNIQPFDEDAGTGELRYVQVIVNFLEVTNNHMKKLYVFLGPALYSTREFVTSNIECRYHRV